MEISSHDINDAYFFDFSVIFNTLFDLCTNLWMAVMMRFLLGCLNGLLVPMKVYHSRNYIKCLDLYP
jgi:hypothetical protein